MIDLSVFGTKGTVGARVCKPMDRRAEIQARADRLKRARESAGLKSARKAAAANNWNYETYRAHENGRNGFEVDVGRTYAERYHVDVAWLMTGDGDPPSPTSHTVNPTDIATRVIQARIYADFSRSELAEKLGLSRTAVFFWESEESIPTTQNLEAIAAITGVSLPWLALGDGEMAQVLNIAQTFSFRLRRSRAKAGYSREDLSKLSGVAKRIISELEEGDSSHADCIPQLASALKISAEWLADGITSHATTVQGSDFVNGSPMAENVSGNVASMKGDGLPMAEVLELNPRRPKAGLKGREEQVRTKWTLPEDFLLELNIPSQFVTVIEVLGDGMLPTLKAGERVVIDTRQVYPSISGVYVIEDRGGKFPQRLQLIKGTEPERVRVLYDNPRYETYTIEADKLNILGIVVKILGLWDLPLPPSA